MGALRQFARGWRVSATALRWMCTALLVLAASMYASSPLRADVGQAGAIGRVEGHDISVENGTAAGGVESGASIMVANGSVVTVHSGHAHLTLFAGGDIEICG